MFVETGSQPRGWFGVPLTVDSRPLTSVVHH